MTTQDLINTLRQGKPMTDKLMREIVRELEGQVALVEALKRYRAACATPNVSYSSRAIAWAEVELLMGGE